MYILQPDKSVLATPTTSGQHFALAMHSSGMDFNYEWTEMADPELAQNPDVASPFVSLGNAVCTMMSIILEMEAGLQLYVYLLANAHVVSWVCKNVAGPKPNLPNHLLQP